jgi:two-component system CheB/CheR fusion protein
MIGLPFYEINQKRWGIPALLELLQEIQKKKSTIEGFPVEVDLGGGGKQALLLNARKVIRKAGKEHLILLAFEKAGSAGPEQSASSLDGEDGTQR